MIKAAIIQNSHNFNSWLNALPQDVLVELRRIGDALMRESTTKKIAPTVENILKPLWYMSLQEVKIAVICKAPYKSTNMATGIPIETGNGILTDTGKEFIRVLQMFVNTVDQFNFMQVYYKLGILVINASFSIVIDSIKKYDMRFSHFPLWASFVRDLILLLNDRAIPILALGTEGKKLLRNITPKNDNFYPCSFPTTDIAKLEFRNTLHDLIQKNILPQKYPDPGEYVSTGVHYDSKIFEHADNRKPYDSDLASDDYYYENEMYDY